jgi:hypothetical protein
LLITNLAGNVTAGQGFQLFDALSSSGNFDTVSMAGSSDGLLWRFNPADGILRGVASNRTNLSCIVSPTHLTLSWPADHLGWSLVTQTNNLAGGLSLDPADWAHIPGAETKTSMVIQLDGDRTTGFYRLVFP